MKFAGIFRTTQAAMIAGFLSAGAMQTAVAAQDPNQFVEQIANNTLQAVNQNDAAKSGDVSAINGIVTQYLMPHINMEKTTRLAVGQPWRQATEQQRSALVNGFKQTLLRTYSGAFRNVTPSTTITMQPFRGDANASDVVVRSTITAGQGPVSVDYRLEKAGNGWKIYDLNVENIWLIQNYRNQFAGQISQGGIDGLIKALNR